MSTDPDYGSHEDRTDAHVANERSAAAAGFGYPEETRTLRFSLDGIDFEIHDAIRSWSTLDDGTLHCGRCRQDATVIGPNLLHSTPMASCQCRAAFMQPISDSDSALLELKFPISEGDQAIGERFRDQLSRLFKSKN